MPDRVEIVRGPGVVIDEGAVVGLRASDEPVVLEEGAHVHAGAILYSGCRVGAFSHVYHHSVLMKGTRIGRHTKIGALCLSQGDVTIGDWVTLVSHCHLTSGMVIGDGAFLAMGVCAANAELPGGRLHRVDRVAVAAPRIERGARIGGHVMIMPSVVVGAEALVGSGAIVTRSLPPFAIAAGSPARVIGEVPPADRIDWDAVKRKATS